MARMPPDDVDTWVSPGCYGDSTPPQATGKNNINGASMDADVASTIRDGFSLSGLVWSMGSMFDNETSEVCHSHNELFDRIEYPIALADDMAPCALLRAGSLAFSV